MKSEEASERMDESSEQNIWERGVWQFLAKIYYRAQLNQTLATPFIFRLLIYYYI